MRETPSVDLAIPHVYSYRAVHDRKNRAAENGRGTAHETRELAVTDLRHDDTPEQPRAVRAIARSISERGLLQPLVVAPRPQGGGYHVPAGHARLAACKALG